MTRRISTILATTAVTALAVPAGASARVAGDPGGGIRAATPPVITTPSTGGFQWDDAGIGAAATLVLVSAGVGAAVTIRRRPVQS